MNMRKRFKKTLAWGLSILMLASFAAAQSRSKENSEDEKPQQSISIMDSTEAQWGRRSVNDSVYKNMPVNAVYLERGKQRLPDSFKMYKPKRLGEENMSGFEEAPTTIRVNGRVQNLQTEDDKSE